MFAYRVAIVLAVINLLGAAPMLISELAGGFAAHNGCRFSEDQIARCMILGADWGPLLQYAAFLIFLWFLTAPIGGLATLLWLLICAIWRIATRGAAVRPAPSNRHLWGAISLAAIAISLNLPLFFAKTGYGHAGMPLMRLAEFALVIWIICVPALWRMSKRAGTQAPQAKS